MSTQETLARLIAARDSLRTAIKGVFVLADQVEARVVAGATLEEVQGDVDKIRSEFDSIYAQVESIREQARVLEPRPDAFLAELATSLDVNRPNNYRFLGETINKAGQNTNRRNTEIAKKAAADQGPQTSSAGAEVTATGISTQAPAAAGQQQSANGAVVTASTTTQPSNAEKFSAPGSDTVAPSATALPSASAPTTSATAGSGPVAGASINTGTGSTREAPPPLAPLPYKAVTVVSSFERGKFTQELEGVLLIFTKPPERVVPGTEDLSYQSTPRVETEGAPNTGTAQPPTLPGTPVARNPNDSNLAQQPVSTPGQPIEPPASTTTLAPAQTAPATSGGQPVAPVTQPDPVALQELEAKLASLNQERRRLRELADLNGPLQREIEALRAKVPTITDPLERQRAQARLDQAQEEMTRYRTELLPEISDEIEQTNNAIFSLQARSASTSAPTQNMAREN